MEQITSLALEQGPLIVLFIFGIYAIAKGVPKIYKDVMAHLDRQDERLDRVESKIDRFEVVIDNNTKTMEKIYSFMEKINENK